MAFPLLTSFGVAGANTAALLLALAVVGAFLAHEPLLVMLGRRGARARAGRRTAALWLGATTATACAAAIGGWWLMDSAVRGSLVAPVLPAAFLAAAVARDREKSLVGEVAAAAAFSLAALPVCLAAGAPLATGLAVAIAFSMIFVLSTLAVRAIVLEVRAGGDARASRSLRRTVVVLAAAALAGLVVAAWRTAWPWASLTASAPGLAAASWLALFPPPPTRLRTVGWTLIAASAAAAAILVAAF
jgi:hypothetical protein